MIQEKYKVSAYLIPGLRDNIDLLVRKKQINVKFCDIVSAVSEQTGISVDSIKGRSRIRRISEARHITMYLMRKYTPATFDEIGKYLNRDHTASIYADGAVKDLMDVDEEYKSTVHEIESIICP